MAVKEVTMSSKVNSNVFALDLALAVSLVSDMKSQLKKISSVTSKAATISNAITNTKAVKGAASEEEYLTLSKELKKRSIAASNRADSLDKKFSADLQYVLANIQSQQKTMAADIAKLKKMNDI